MLSEILARNSHEHNIAFHKQNGPFYAINLMLYLFFHQIKPSEASILEYLVLVEDLSVLVRFPYLPSDPGFVLVMTHDRMCLTFRWILICSNHIPYFGAREVSHCSILHMYCKNRRWMLSYVPHWVLVRKKKQSKVASNLVKSPNICSKHNFISIESLPW